MRKKLLTILALLALSVNFTACSNEKTTESKESKEIQSTAENSNQETNSTEEKTLNDIEQFLLSNGVLSGERIRMAAEMVGGLDGFKYADSGTEIYEYDVNSKEYQDLSSGKEIPIKGMEDYTVGAVSINGKFVLIGEPSERAIEVFNSFR